MAIRPLMAAEPKGDADHSGRNGGKGELDLHLNGDDGIGRSRRFANPVTRDSLQTL